MGKRLYVGSLPFEITEDELHRMFTELGQVVSVKLITDRDTGQSKGFGFVEMSSDQEAAKATQALNDTDFEGRNIVVSEARPQAPRESRPGGRGGFGGDRPPRRDRD